MPNSTDVREWARAEGLEVKDRGRLSPVLVARYEETHPTEHDDAEPDTPAGGDYDQGVTEADFPPGSEDETGAAVAPASVGERRPRKVRGARPKGSFRTKLWGHETSKPARPAHQNKPRVSLKGFAEDMCLDLAWSLQALPPLEKILYLQAPLAGDLVEGMAKGTAADRLLQPVARADQNFKRLEALTAPLWVAAIMTRGRKDDQGRYSPETVMMFGGLRHALLSMSRVTTTDFEELKAKSEDMRSASGQIDAMIAWLFEMPGAPEDQPAAPQTANGQTVPA